MATAFSELRSAKRGAGALSSEQAPPVDQPPWATQFMDTIKSGIRDELHAFDKRLTNCEGRLE
eukprot:7978994-Alexandrium_andersonii.AAC.1